MSRLQTMRYVVLPQAVSISMPAFMANIIILLPVSLLGSWLERRLRYAGFGS